MSGLSLLASYSSSSEEDSPDERPAKRMKSQENNKVTIKRLPLPSIFAKSQQVEQHEDDPQQHGGRTRVFPHERGNWSTFVYIPYEPNEHFFKLVNHLHELCSRVSLFQRVEDFHISLSRTVVLKFHWINNFISELRTQLDGLNKFEVIFDSLNVYCNDDKSRTFLSLKVGLTGADELKNLVGRVDSSLQEFKLPIFYEDPSFHLSLLWCIGDKTSDLQTILPSSKSVFNEISDKLSLDGDNFCDQLVDCVICKSGNKIFSFSLK